MILSNVNEIEAKFKQHYKVKSSNFIIVLKLNFRNLTINDALKVCGYLNLEYV